MACGSTDRARHAAAALLAAALVAAGCGGDDRPAGAPASTPADAPPVAYLRGRAGLWDLVLQRRTGPARTIVRHTPSKGPLAFSFSADGGSVVVLESTDTSQRLLTVQIADRRRKEIGAYGPSTYYSVAAAPDGERLAAVRAGESGHDFVIEILAMDGTSLRTVGAGVDIGSGISWSPDGRSVAYAHRDDHHGDGVSHVRLVDAETGAEETFGDRLQGTDPVLAADGTLAYASAKGIVVRPPDGSLRRVTGGGVAARPSFSPDGRRIAYQHQPRCPRRRPCPTDVLVVGSSGSRPRNLTRTPKRSESFPAWRPATP
jgi:Tol biopolymer transport system component